MFATAVGDEDIVIGNRLANRDIVHHTAHYTRGGYYGVFRRAVIIDECEGVFFKYAEFVTSGEEVTQGLIALMKELLCYLGRKECNGDSML